MLIKFLLNGKKINLTSDDIIIESTNFSVDKNGNMDCSNAEITGGRVEIYGGKELNEYGDGLNFKCSENQNTQYPYSGTTPQMNIIRNGQSSFIRSQVGSVSSPLSTTNSITIQSNSNNYITHTSFSSRVGSTWHASNGTTYVNGSGITTPTLTQTSIEKDKKNFEKFEHALDIIKKVDIYKYNLSFEENTDKKHIGFVIGDNYNYSEELTSKENDGVDIYSLASCCLQGIKEQQEIIENQEKNISELQEKIKRLEEK